MAAATRIRWKADVPLSAIHAARVVAVGAPCNDEKLERALVPFVTEINGRLLTSSIDIRLFWNQLVSDVLRFDSVDRACETSLVASGCSELQADQTSRGIVRQLDECRLALTQRFPRLGDQLELRANPIKDRWESVGPGLLNAIAKQIWKDATPKTWWSPRLDARLVQPVRGGDGGFGPQGIAFWIEALLTDVDPRVPEVLRVAWLITRGAIEKHVAEKSTDVPAATPDSRTASGIRPIRLLPAWAFASVPLTLHAAAELDMIPAENLPIAEAIERWRLSKGPMAGDIVSRWWNDFQSHPLPLPVALKTLLQALERGGE
ncbi:hypothetical protein [Novipirellula artificiosorum]|uniref:Uncharacterized protein n=1 Tax=Novipirellula artificiosorum TaxID=2528016 RepID=A0A5C6DF45_9BACT|nr:hypothetical protein [Novipirellula artificiosorum]TWU33746.1 hypothetical protein Poly41_47430 [Novipirellula artificiosorum]